MDTLLDNATPMLRQYQQIKARHKDCILFFRLGDFYEMFFEDAKTASGILGLVLTARGKGTASHVPMCGIPYHAADGYIARLIKAGRKVAICEQLEDPALAKGIVQRDVTRIITSGTFLDENSTDARYLLCLCPSKETIGMAFIDPVAGTIQANQFASAQKIIEIIARLPVYECVCPTGRADEVQRLFQHPLLRGKTIVQSAHEDWCFNPDIAGRALCEHFHLPNLRGFGVADLDAAVSAAGGLLEYLRQMNKQPVRHIDRIALYSDEDFTYLSPAAVYGLELETLFKTLNHTLTPMGRRLLRFWLYHPLRDESAILLRQAAVSLLKDRPEILAELKDILSRVPDIEKSLSRLSCGYRHPKDFLALRNALGLLPDLLKTLSQLDGQNPLLGLEDIPDLRDLLTRAVNPQLPLSNPEGRIINPGFHDELDRLRGIQENGRQWLKNLQEQEIKRTGINSLKVGFNKVFGYYLEVTKANQNAVPADYIRKQTLVNGERFITPQLKEYEETLLTAQDKIFQIENDLLAELQRKILDQSSDLHQFSQSVAVLDALFSLTVLARQPHYTAPQITTDTIIDIKEGRHPVVEHTTSGNFVPNDTYLDCDTQHLIILTGPNMAGKSTYIRQIAILVIMAQMGSFVPAASARIGIVDKLFTRIGAHDDISRGQSTFMVEMNETAEILNNLSARSLIILDEIGRGTSTFDGLSLAWALAEHLQATKARTLFATHFHELTALAQEHTGVKNYNVAVKEWKDEIIFLHKIIPGSTDDSYGIYVAKLAGVPKAIIERAKKILTRLELKDDLRAVLTSPAHSPVDTQMSLFSASGDTIMAAVRQRLDEVDLNQTTPLAALNTLQELKKLIEEPPS